MSDKDGGGRRVSSSGLWPSPQQQHRMLPPPVAQRSTSQMLSGKPQPSLQSRTQRPPAGDTIDTEAPSRRQSGAPHVPPQTVGGFTFVLPTPAGGGGSGGGGTPAGPVLGHHGPLSGPAPQSRSLTSSSSVMAEFSTADTLLGCTNVNQSPAPGGPAPAIAAPSLRGRRASSTTTTTTSSPSPPPSQLATVGAPTASVRRLLPQQTVLIAPHEASDPISPLLRSPRSSRRSSVAAITFAADAAVVGAQHDPSSGGVSLTVDGGDAGGSTATTHVLGSSALQQQHDSGLGVTTRPPESGGSNSGTVGPTGGVQETTAPLRARIGTPLSLAVRPVSSTPLPSQMDALDRFLHGGGAGGGSQQMLAGVHTPHGGGGVSMQIGLSTIQSSSAGSVTPAELLALLGAPPITDALDDHMSIGGGALPPPHTSGRNTANTVTGSCSDASTGPNSGVASAVTSPTMASARLRNPLVSPHNNTDVPQLLHGGGARAFPIVPHEQHPPVTTDNDPLRLFHTAAPSSSVPADQQHVPDVLRQQLQRLTTPAYSHRDAFVATGLLPRSPAGGGGGAGVLSLSVISPLEPPRNHNHAAPSIFDASHNAATNVAAMEALVSPTSAQQQNNPDVTHQHQLFVAKPPLSVSVRVSPMSITSVAVPDAVVATPLPAQSLTSSTVAVLAGSFEPLTTSSRSTTVANVPTSQLGADVRGNDVTCRTQGGVDMPPLLGTVSTAAAATCDPPTTAPPSAATSTRQTQLVGAKQQQQRSATPVKPTTVVDDVSKKGTTTARGGSSASSLTPPQSPPPASRVVSDYESQRRAAIQQKQQQQQQPLNKSATATTASSGTASKRQSTSQQQSASGGPASHIDKVRHQLYLWNAALRAEAEELQRQTHGTMDGV